MSWLDTAITYRHVVYAIASVLGAMGIVLAGVIIWALIESAAHTRHARTHYDGDEG